MKLFAGLAFPGLWLMLLSCCCRVQANGQAVDPASTVFNGTNDQADPPVPASEGTNHTSTAPVVKPTTNITTTTTQNGTQPVVPSAVPSNTTASTTTITHTTVTTRNITTPTANPPPAKTNTTKVSPTSPKSTSVTTVTPKAPTSTNSTAVTASPKAAATLPKSSGFDVGSFIGGIVLTLGLLIIGYIGCRTYHAKRGVQYRTIDEHDAII